MVRVAESYPYRSPSYEFFLIFLRLIRRELWKTRFSFTFRVWCLHFPPTSGQSQTRCDFRSGALATWPISLYSSVTSEWCHLSRAWEKTWVSAPSKPVFCFMIAFTCICLENNVNWQFVSIHSNYIVTASRRSCGKVMFSEVCVIMFTEGGGACVAGGVCG